MTIADVLADFEKTLADATAVGATQVVADCQKGIADCQSLMTGLGTITSSPLPAQSGSTYGVNYYGFPFVSNRGSKQSDMAWCPLTSRIYVQGGDTIHSATDGTWSCDSTGSDWLLEVGQPVYPTLAAPHDLQDDFGIAWRAVSNEMVLWPGSYFAYEKPGTPILNYTGGVWFYNPVTKTYRQDTRLFPNKPQGGVSPGITAPGTGCPFGGVYDDVNDEIVAFTDGGVYSMVHWSLTTMTELPPIKFLVTCPPKTVAYFARTRQEKIGRKVYIIGYFSAGTQASQTPLLLCWDLDAHTISQLTPPPIPVIANPTGQPQNGVFDASCLRDIEIKFGSSHGKIVWPVTFQPNGDIFGIRIYDPATNTWSLDTQVPSYGNFIENSLCSLPDGRVAWSGGNFGKQQTHFWFYEAA